MIKKGIHQSAVIDFAGEKYMPLSTIIEPCVVIYGSSNAKILLGENNIIYPGCIIRIDLGELKSGNEVSFGPGCLIYEPRAGLTIGNHCIIGGGTIISGVNHGHSQIGIPMRNQPTNSLPIIIEDDVWIGMGVKILPGIKIGTGSIIGAGSVVTKDIPPFSVAIGNPCRIIRQRKK